MAHLFENIDEKINEKEQELKRLQEERKAHQRKLEGVKAFDAAVEKICKDYDLQPWELYFAQSEKVTQYVKKMARLDETPEVFQKLTSYFTSRGSVKTRKRAPNKRTEPKLEVGVYKNPHTKETVEKKRRAPRQLLDWCEKYGADKVRKWHQG